MSTSEIITFLYIKTHNVTGLKYFGKTTQEPYTYPGSGKRWKSHLKKHGNDVTTEIHGSYTDEEKLVAAALTFSHENNIVKDKIWANLMEENGLDGALPGKPLSDETKMKLSAAKSGENNPNYGKTPSDETKKKLSAALSGENHPLYGKTHSDETKMKMSAALSGENNPNYGKTASDETKKKLSAAQSGKTHSDETKKKLSAANSGENHPNYGKPLSDEHKMKLSAALKGIPKPKVPCPHCDMSMSKARLPGHIKARH
jgi:group I intron endonuclease